MSDVARVARRFGVEWSEEQQCTVLRRHRMSVRLRGELSWRTPDDRHLAFCAILGARLGLDALVLPASARDVALQRVLPRGAVSLSDRIGEMSTPTRALVAGSQLVVVGLREHGKLLVPTAADQATARELFYRAYKLRPGKPTHGLADSKVACWEESGGIAPSLASLLPDFDLDAARDGAFVLIPSYTRMIIITGTPTAASVRALGRDEIANAEMPMSRRLYRLTLGGLTAGEVVDVGAEFDGAVVAENLIGVDR